MKESSVHTCNVLTCWRCVGQPGLLWEAPGMSTDLRAERTRAGLPSGAAGVWLSKRCSPPIPALFIQVFLFTEDVKDGATC